MQPATLTSLDAVVGSFIAREREHVRQELQYYAGQPTLARAIEEATLSRHQDGTRHPHQRQGGDILERATGALLSAELARAKSFSELYDMVQWAIGSIRGIGDVTIYDVAHRIGAHLGLEPEAVYLHAGAKEGARTLGLRGSALRKDALPRAFAPLTPAEIEDCLCLYKDALKAIGAGRRITS